jgi:hypothetical protein
MVFSLITQVFMTALRTPWGERTVPDLLVRAGFLRAAQRGQLVSFLHPPGSELVPSLERQIKEELPANQPIQVVCADVDLVISAENLRYQLYPRILQVRMGTRGDKSEPGCRIDWQSERDIQIACPGSVRRFIIATDNQP